MSAATRFITRAYALLVRLYPHSFRAEFEEEMRAVFAAAVADAARRGGRSLIGVCLQELRDWPRALLSQYWLSARTRRGPASSHLVGEGSRAPGHDPGCDTDGRYVMSETKRGGAWSIDSQRQALVAALPPLLFGLGGALASQIVYGVPLQSLSSWRIAVGVAVGLIPVAVLAIGGLIALTRRLPDWGYTWVASNLIGLFLLLTSLAEDREFLISPVVDVAVGSLLLLAGLAVLAVAALRGWPQAGLVSIALSTTLGLSLCAVVASYPFRRTDLAMLAVPLGLLVAALIYVYTRGSGPARVVVLLGVGLLNAGLIWMADQVWQTWAPSHGVSRWPLVANLTGLLLAGPLLSLLLRPLRRAVGRESG